MKLVNKKQHSFLWSSLIILALGIGFSNVTLAGKGGGGGKGDHGGVNIITDIVSAPVVTNGLVAGEPTEFNILLNAPGEDNDVALDPENFSHQIPAGGRMEVELGGTYVRNRDSSGTLVVDPIVANRNIILTIAPQNPIVATAGTGVQHGNWSVTDDGDRLITISPNGGTGANGLENDRANIVGFKVIHVRPNARSGFGPAPFLNGPAGTVGTVDVRIIDAQGKLVESGSVNVKFEASVGRQVHITNAGLTTGGQGSPTTTTAELVESTNFQRVAPNTSMTNTAKTNPFSAGAPYAPRFLLFEALEDQPDSFIPQVGIENVTYTVNSRKPSTATLTENGTTIGTIEMKGPKKSNGTILVSPGLTTIGGNGSVLNVPVQVGSKPGLYTVQVELLFGGEAKTTIVVE